jgi:heme-degrading monooxygenase HmoA
MYVAMNRFRITPGHEAAFEEMWRNRDSQLAGVDGFESFKLLKGPVADGHALYISHSTWASRAAFEAWTKSPHFRRAHAAAAASKEMYLGPPVFEGFESVVES